MLEAYLNIRSEKTEKPS